MIHFFSSDSGSILPIVVFAAVAAAITIGIGLLLKRNRLSCLSFL